MTFPGRHLIGADRTTRGRQLAMAKSVYLGQTVSLGESVTADDASEEEGHS